MAEPSNTAQEPVHTDRGESSVPSAGSHQPDHMSALLQNLNAEAASAQITDAPALTDLLHRLAGFHTAERPVEMPDSSQTPAENTSPVSLPTGARQHRFVAPVIDSTPPSSNPQDQQPGSDAASLLRPEETPLHDSSSAQPSSAFDRVTIMIDSPQNLEAGTMMSHLLEYDNRQQQERDRLRDAEERDDAQAASASTARVRLNRHFRSRQLPAPPAVGPSRPAATLAQPQPPPASAPPRHSPPQLDPRPSVRLRLSDESGGEGGGIFFGGRDRIALPVPFQQFTTDTATGRMVPFFTAASGAGALRPTNTAANTSPNVGFLELLQPLESSSAPPTVLRTTASDPSQPFAEPNWPEVPVAVNTDHSSSGSGSGSGSDGDRDAPLFVPARSAGANVSAPQQVPLAAQHMIAERLAKHASALPVGFTLKLDVRLKQSLQAARDVDSTELTRILQAYLQAMDVMVQEYDAAGALVAGDTASMAPCAASLNLLRDRVKGVCDGARSALRMQGSGRREAMLEAEKQLASVLHGNVLHKTALFARCTIVPCLDDDVDVTTLPASHASLLCAINNHVRSMRSIQLRRFQRRQGATAFAAVAASLVRAQPGILKPCPTWIQALQVLVSASLPPLPQPLGRHWATARLPPQPPGRGGGRPPGIARPRGASEARMGRAQRAALSISPAGGAGTDARRARGSGGGHRSGGSRTRPRSDPTREPLPAPPTAAEFPDSLVAYILELFGRTTPPQGPETPRAVDPDSRPQATTSEDAQDDRGGAVSERVERDEDSNSGLISLPELVSPRHRSNAVIWFDEPLADGSV